MLKGNLLYGQGGGPSSVINCSAYGLIKEAFIHEEINEVFAARFGLDGIINNELIKITPEDNIESLQVTPGAAFGSNRIHLDYEKDKIIFQKIFKAIKDNNIRYFFYNGGNDSMDTINKIDCFLKDNNYECRCIGLNKTIDNDLPSSDFSLGYLTSAIFIANVVTQITIDDASYKVGRVNIIETMGRNTGWLAASSKLCKLVNCEPDLIYVAEGVFDINQFLKDVKNIYEKKKHCIVVVSEGLKNKKGEFILKANSNVDKFGHSQLGGLGIILTKTIEKEFGYKTRYMELSLMQRASTYLPVDIEKEIAINASKYALKEAIKGNSGKGVIIIRKTSSPYEYEFSLEKLSIMANEVQFLPLKYINKDGNGINDNFLEYISPLVEGTKYLVKPFRIK